MGYVSDHGFLQQRGFQQVLSEFSGGINLE